MQSNYPQMYLELIYLPSGFLYNTDTKSLKWPFLPTFQNVVTLLKALLSEKPSESVINNLYRTLNFSGLDFRL